MQILLWAIPFFVVTMLLEGRLTRRHDVRGYWLEDAATNLAMGLGNLGIMFGTKVVTLALFIAVHEHRLFDIPTDAWWAWALLIVHWNLL